MKRPGEVLRAQEVRRLLGACGPSTTGVRNSALIAVMYRAGLRVSEALALKLGDVDLEHGLLHVRSGKGGKARVAAIDRGGVELVRRWIDRRSSLLSGRRSAILFVTHSGAAVLPSHVRTLCKRLARKACIDRRVHPHAFRHSHAFELANEDVPPHYIQHQLGHESLETTTVYLRHLGAGDLRKKIGAREWNV